MRHANKLLLAAVPLVLAACVSMPSGPSVMVLPGTGMSFEQFRLDDMLCRQYASGEIGQTAEGAATQTTVSSAAVGTVIGAVAGAALNGRHGAAVGAGTGLMVGTVSGAGAAQLSAQEAQKRYDNAFVQCMYAKGHRVPVSGHYSPDRAPAAPAPGAAPYPPPPPASR